MFKSRLLLISLLVAAACSSSSDHPSDEVGVCGVCSGGHKCNVATGKCVAVPDDAGTPTDGGEADAGVTGCASSDECPPGAICQEGSCVPGCTSQHACADNLECCGGSCVDVSTDMDHCGGCEAPVCNADQQCVGGECTGGAAGAKTTGVMSLFEVKGSVQSPIGTVKVTLLVPVANFPKEDATHAFSNRQDGMGCVADHFDNNSNPAPHDGSAGTITISGFAGGSVLTGGSSGTTMTCTRPTGIYSCNFSNDQPAAAQPFGENASPLGNGPITFSGTGASDFGAFTLQHSSSGTLTTSENLSSVTYSTSQDKTISYTCSNCTDSLISVTLIATQNSVSNPSGASSTSGVVSCLFPAGSSFTIPKGAIAAMFGNDTSLKSVATTIVRVSSTFATGADGDGRTVVANTGRGVVGIAPK